MYFYWTLDIIFVFLLKFLYKLANHKISMLSEVKKRCIRSRNIVSSQASYEIGQLFYKF